MESIIKFLEQYWGYTLFGGLSLGTIATFTITQIKSLVANKVKGTIHEEQINTVLNRTDQVCSELNAKLEAGEIEKKELLSVIAKQNKQLTEQAQYFEKVQATTFQAISYLVMASKLSTDDKIALQEKFVNLGKEKITEYSNIVVEETKELKQDIPETVIPDAVETVNSTITETKSLLDKYTTKEV